MSKNLETEYKNLINSRIEEIPDLWSRIEAGLGEQEPSLSLYSDGTARPGTEAKPGKTRRGRWRVFAGIAAAAACVCIIVPVALSVGNSGHSSYSAATAEAVPEEMFMEEAAAESTGYDEEAAYPEEAYEEAAYAEAANEEAAFEESSEKAFLGEANEAAAAFPDADEAAAAEDYDEIAPEGVILSNVEFEITEAPADGRVTALILSCPDDPSFEGQTVVLSEGGEGAPSLPGEPGIYTAELQADTDEDGSIVFKLTDPTR